MIGANQMQALLLSSFVTIALLVSAGRAFCQTSSPAIFRGAENRNEDTEGLGAIVELFQAYDDNVLASESGNTERPPNPYTVGGMYSGLNVGVQHLAVDDQGLFRLWANTALRYFPDLRDMGAAYHQAGLTFSRELTKGMRVYASPFAAYSPLYSMQLLPESDRDLEVVQEPSVFGNPDFEFAVIRERNIRYGGNAGVNFTFSPASSLRLAYGYGKTEFTDRARDLEVRTAGLFYNHRMSKNASLELGYQRHEGTGYAVGPQLVETVNIGVDYQKPLSRSRRTMARFSTGSSIAENATGGRRLEAIGSAVLEHQMGRTWTAEIDYRRGYRYLDGFERPVFSDSADASLQGLLNRRLELSMYASYFTGAVRLSADSPRFESYLASGRLRSALSKTLAAYVEFRYYHYQFDETVVRPPGVPYSFGRRGVRAGLSLFLPFSG
jgi:hypothetical protein